LKEEAKAQYIKQPSLTMLTQEPSSQSEATHTTNPFSLSLSLSLFSTTDSPS